MKPTAEMIAEATSIYKDLRRAGFSKKVATFEAKRLAEDQYFEREDAKIVETLPVWN